MSLDWTAFRDYTAINLYEKYSFLISYTIFTCLRVRYIVAPIDLVVNKSIVSVRNNRVLQQFVFYIHSPKKYLIILCISRATNEKNAANAPCCKIK